MLTEYMEKALERAEYRKLDDGKQASTEVPEGERSKIPC